ncbi:MULTISPECIES: PLP-dependent aminotransferase family protein [unclassified Myxococcus]|uniref:MocR-like pyridoxine biosynthesis transcription factor PdxR n=1 Tax=unclassified Myxococcus TaxID=2648731 RepID=UPI00157B2898|nr:MULTISPECIES: PLP-dependent aminotransferase family protein [unclassified Myxococcus]NTX34928.1 PLP-dependent aminotransferase family protein [Myxococcus sp. CA033]NTX53332.1 PLP-dependent aminotransferase family protein [Myxococcus sp. CA039A]
MSKRSVGVSLPFLLPDTGRQAGSLHRRLYERLREAILAGTLAPRSRLPSTRTLSRELGISRGTVEEAFAQLDAEGFLERRVGSGSVVALPEHARQPRSPLARGSAKATRQGGLSRRGQRMASEVLPPEPRDVRPFTPCLPALDLFPAKLWARAVAKQARVLEPGRMTAGEPEGFRPLREAIAAHLGPARGVRCDWRRVLVFSSTQQALDLSARLLLDEGDGVWLEEPGYLGARVAFESAGARLHPVPVDAEGPRVELAVSRAPKARLAYVTPSHQYPLGVTMSLSRRLALLEHARASGMWLFEDDYDSEFRYATRPLAAIQGMDVAGRVLYAGTFNKVMFPSLRLAFLVVPETLVDAFTAARAATDGHAPPLTQAAMARFMESGHYAAHLRQMRLVYAERRDALLDSLKREAPGVLRIGTAEAGMHVTAFLSEGLLDEAVIARTDARRLGARRLSPLYLGRKREQGLVLGFSGASPAGLRAAVRTLCGVLDGPTR